MVGVFKTARLDLLHEFVRFPLVKSDLPRENVLDRAVLITYYLKVYNFDTRTPFVRL